MFSSMRPISRVSVRNPLHIAPVRRNKSMWAKYSEALETNPIPTKVITSGVICGSGDCACQMLSTYVSGEKSEPYDFLRTLRFATMGSFFIAPSLHIWYGKLSQMFPGTSTSSVIKRLCFDQFVFAPVFLAGFFTVSMTLEGNMHQIGDRLRTSLKDTVITNWGIWIPAQMINFKFIPQPAQVLFANVIGFFWNGILSYLNSKPVETSQETK